MSNIKFVLNLTIEGESLEDIDNGLAQAAGARLIARMENPPKLNGKTIVTGPTITGPANNQGRTPAQLRSDAEVSRKHQERIAKGRAENIVKESKEQQKEEALPIVKALHAVWVKHGKEAAEACLAKFGVKRLGELSPDQHEGFVQHCNSQLEDTQEVESEINQ